MSEAPVFGPYETEAATYAEPMPARVHALHEAGRVRSGDPDGVARDAKLAALLEACEAAGVELGGFDRATLEWLAGWEPSTVQVLVGIISRVRVGA
jgi:hypothetical protein